MIKTIDTWSKGYEILHDTVKFSKENITEVTSKATFNKEVYAPVNPTDRTDQSYRYTARSANEVSAFAINTFLSLGYNDFSSCHQLKVLAETMFERFKTNYLKCRMDLIYSDSCRKFHIDSLHMRSITTLIGPGTEYKLTKNNCEIHQVKTGDTILLKGSMYPGKRSKVLHRSPQISKLGIHRLVFVMDY